MIYAPVIVLARPNPSVVVLVPGVIVLGGLAMTAVIAWQKYKRRDQVEDTASDVAGSVVPSGIPGVYMKSGVNLTDSMRAFLPKLRALLDFDITVTSGLRTPAEQASAMIRNWQQYGGSSGGTAYLHNLYRDDSLIDEIAPAMPDQGVVTQVLQSQVDRGRYVSDHMGGDGLDFRTRDLSAGQMAGLKDAGEQLGAQMVVESNHYHMENFSSGTAMNIVGQASYRAKKNMPYVIGASAIAGVALLGFWWWTRRST